MRCAEAPRCGFPSGLGVEARRSNQPTSMEPKPQTSTSILEPRLPPPASVGSPLLLLQHALASAWDLGAARGSARFGEAKRRYRVDAPRNVHFSRPGTQVDGSSLKPPARKDQHGPARWVPSALPGMSVIDCDARSKAEGPHPRDLEKQRSRRRSRSARKPAVARRNENRQSVRVVVEKHKHGHEPESRNPTQGFTGLLCKTARFIESPSHQQATESSLVDEAPERPAPLPTPLRERAAQL
jgi:hypothetical protein